jgi:hypothetical protein
MSAVMSGARMKVGMVDPSTGLTSIIGIYASVDYALIYSTEPAFTLGRFSAAANDYVSQEIINLTCSGFRVIGSSAFVVSGLPQLQNLLLSDYIQLALIDRQSELKGAADARMGKFFSVRCTGFNTGANAKSLQQMTVHYQAINLGEENVPSNIEGPGATSLPIDPTA